MNLKQRAEAMAMSHFLCDEGDFDFDGLIEQLRAGRLPKSVNPWEPFENCPPKELAEEMETYAEFMERQLLEAVRPVAEVLRNLGAAIEDGNSDRIAHAWLYEGKKRLDELGLAKPLSLDEFNAADERLLQRIKSLGPDAIDQLAIECIKNGYEGEDLGIIAETLSMYYGSSFIGIYHEDGGQITASSVSFLENLADIKLAEIERSKQTAGETV